MRWPLDRGVAIRAVRSDVSTVENTLDALDNVEVVTGVAAIRDQGGLFSGVLPKSAICEDDFGGLEVVAGQVLPAMLPRMCCVPLSSRRRSAQARSGTRQRQANRTGSSPF
jgi:hypothetical protein